MSIVSTLFNVYNFLQSMYSAFIVVSNDTQVQVLDNGRTEIKDPP